MTESADKDRRVPDPGQTGHLDTSSRDSARPPPLDRAAAWAVGALPVFVVSLAFRHLLASRALEHGRDDLEFTAPFALFLRRSLMESGSFPFFNPYTDSGLSFFSRLPVAEPFYPTTLLFFFLPMGRALDLGAFLHVCLAAWGTFLLARRIGLGRGAALAPAIAYPLSSIFVVAAGQGYSDVVVTWALFPFLLLASEAASQSAAAGSPRPAACWSAAGGLVLGLLLLGGSPAHDVAALLAWSL